MMVRFVVVLMKKSVVTARAEAFGVQSHFSFTPLASAFNGLPMEFFVTGIAEAFGVMLFFAFAVCTRLDHSNEKTFAYKNVVQTA